MKSNNKEEADNNMQIPHWWTVNPFLVALKTIFQNSIIINWITNSNISIIINNGLFPIL